MRKPITGFGVGKNDFVVICDDGTMWKRKHSETVHYKGGYGEWTEDHGYKWVQIEAIPEEKVKKKKAA